MNLKSKKLKIAVKATSFAVVFALTCGIITRTPEVQATTAADEITDRIQQLQQESEALQQKIDEADGDIADNKDLQDNAYSLLQGQKDVIDDLNYQIYDKQTDIEDLEGKIDDLQDGVDKKEAKIAEMDQAISDKEKEIEDKNAKIEELEEENKENIEKFGQIVKTMYMNGNNDVISILMGSTDFYDMLVRSELVQNIGQQNVDFMNDLLEEIDSIEQKKEDLQSEITQLGEDKKTLQSEKDELVSAKEELDGQKDILEGEKTELDSSKQESQSLADKYNQDYNTYSYLIGDLEQKQDEYAEKIRANADEVAKFEVQLQQMLTDSQDEDKVYVSDEEWHWPVGTQFHYISTYFGYDAWRGGNHSGIDIGDSGINGTPIYATKSGTVQKAIISYIPGYSYGMYVVLDHGGGVSSLYGHCSAIYVTEGQEVKQGDIIAAVGSTGWSTGPHLHFEIRVNSIAQNPFNYVTLP